MPPSIPTVRVVHLFTRFLHVLSQRNWNFNAPFPPPLFSPSTEDYIYLANVDLVICSCFLWWMFVICKGAIFQESLWEWKGEKEGGYGKWYGFLFLFAFLFYFFPKEL